MSRCLRVVSYTRGRRRVHLEICPACGYEYTHGEDRHEHITEHAPEDFGLRPLGKTTPDHNAPLFGGEARGD